MVLLLSGIATLPTSKAWRRGVARLLVTGRPKSRAANSTTPSLPRWAAHLSFHGHNTLATAVDKAGTRLRLHLRAPLHRPGAEHRAQGKPHRRQLARRGA